MSRPGTGWSIVVGLGLALVAAGSFVAFSLIARHAGVPLRAEKIVPRQAAGAGAVMTLGEPPVPQTPTTTLLDLLDEGSATDEVLGTRAVVATTDAAPRPPAAVTSPPESKKPKKAKKPHPGKGGRRLGGGPKPGGHVARPMREVEDRHGKSFGGHAYSPGKGHDKSHNQAPGAAAEAAEGSSKSHGNGHAYGHSKKDKEKHH